MTSVRPAFAVRLGIVLAVCLLGLTLSARVTSAAPFQLTVQPIQVCQTDGTNCANAARQLFEPETDKIWAQAGIDVQFLPWTTFNSTAYLSIQNAPAPAYVGNEVGTEGTFGQEILDLWLLPNHGASASEFVVNMFFVQSLFPDVSGTNYGVGALGAGYAAVSDATFSYNGGIGRRDTIAHELAHTLGLAHYTGADVLHNLMASGSSRGIPNSVADITPDGAGFDQLTAGQLDIVFESDLVQPIPEPGSLILLATGLLLVGYRQMRRRQE